jgi:Family of unknown function (DUF6174)
MTLLLAVLACSTEGPKDSELDEARDRWEENAPTHYRYVEDELTTGSSLGPVIIEVDDGAIVYALYTETDEPAPAARTLTIDELFDKAQGELDAEPDDITIVYDEALGFPKSVDVDPYENGMDDEYGWTATQFETL